MKKVDKIVLKKMMAEAGEHWTRYKFEKRMVQIWEGNLARYENYGWYDLVNIYHHYLDEARCNAEAELRMFRAFVRDIRAMI